MWWDGGDGVRKEEGCVWPRMGGRVWVESGRVWYGMGIFFDSVVRWFGGSIYL